MYVFQPSLDDLIEVYEIRRALGGLAASLAADCVDGDGLPHLEEQLLEMSNSQGTARWFTAHERFQMVATLKRRDSVTMDTIEERHLNTTDKLFRQLLAISLSRRTGNPYLCPPGRPGSRWPRAMAMPLNSAGLFIAPESVDTADGERESR